MIIYMQDNGIAAVCSLASSVPDGVTYIETTTAPQDRKFRDAWEIQGNQLVEDLTKSKGIAHDMRRATREAAMKPYDEVISKQIPGQDATAAEDERAKIRTADAILQTNIDNTVDIINLRSLI